MCKAKKKRQRGTHTDFAAELHEGLGGGGGEEVTGGWEGGRVKKRAGRTGRAKCASLAFFTTVEPRTAANVRRVRPSQTSHSLSGYALRSHHSFLRSPHPAPRPDASWSRARSIAADAPLSRLSSSSLTALLYHVSRVGGKATALVLKNTNGKWREHRRQCSPD